MGFGIFLGSSFSALFLSRLGRDSLGICWRGWCFSAILTCWAHVAQLPHAERLSSNPYVRGLLSSARLFVIFPLLWWHFFRYVKRQRFSLNNWNGGVLRLETLDPSLGLLCGLMMVPQWSTISWQMGQSHRDSIVLSNLHFYRSEVLFQLILTPLWIPFMVEANLKDD